MINMELENMINLDYFSLNSMSQSYCTSLRPHMVKMKLKKYSYALAATFISLSLFSRYSSFFFLKDHSHDTLQNSAGCAKSEAVDGQ